MNKEDIWNNKSNYSVSLITLNQLDVSNQLSILKSNSINMLHLDLVDGVFSPEFPLGLRMIEDVIKVYGDTFFTDAHVMCYNPEFYIDKLIDYGVNHINFQYECAEHVDRLLNKIQCSGIKAGVGLKPATPISTLEYIIEKCDSVLVMLFNPGYSWDKNEKQITYTYRKVYDLHEMIQKRNLNTKIILDGRVSHKNIKAFSQIIDGIYVLGSTSLNLSSNDALKTSLKEVNAIINEGGK